MVAVGIPAAWSKTSFPPIRAVQMIPTNPALLSRRSPAFSTPLSRARRIS